MKKLIKIAEWLILLGIVAIVVGAFLVDVILGLFVLGVSLILVGIVLLKVVAKRQGGG